MSGELRLPVSRPVTVVGAGTTLASALAVMDRDGVRHLPVVVSGESGGESGDHPVDDRVCVGLLLDRDLVLAVGADPAAAGRPVGTLARAAVPRVPPGAPARDVARMMLRGGLDAALVVDDGCLVGIVTASDALRALAAEDARPEDAPPQDDRR